ncbi:hypothetical protein [Chryseobacterium chendengshani]|uniref:hypothetical protein n=1 Tax=Chryseobacterium sp. LJ756 TaxID=2864113 RepID=UPI001C641B52|nr:hypothetical protein [Chryseobacterium sp. LJ756]MBW7674214.1 hypothetical protein [Chryseobacterium sp. LJ756]
MKKIQFTLIFLFSLITNAQISSKTERIIKPLEKYIFFYALNDEPKKIEKKLLEISSNDELFYLSENGKNPYVKATSFKILAQKNDERLSEIFKNAINSTEELRYTTECLSSEQLLSSYFFETIITESHFSIEKKEVLKKEMIESVFNSKQINTRLLEELKYQIPTDNDAYLKLRKQILESNSEELLIALAKYKNPNDIELIKSFGEKSFLAIEEFPDNSFLPFLDENVQYSSKFPFMFALSSFCNDEAKIIMQKAINRKKADLDNDKCGNTCLSVIYQQVYKNKCELYYPMLENLWVSDKIISFDILDNYEKNHSKEETINFLMKGFEKDGEPEIIANNMYDMSNLFDNVTNDLTYNDDLRLIKLLKRVKNLSEESYENAIRNSLKNVDDLNTDSFIASLNENIIILKNKEILLEKMKTNESAYGLISIMDGIKILGDKDLFDQGAKILVQRKNEFSKYPIWQKSYKEYVRKNNIKE